MKCPHCGAEVNGSDAFCGDCGGPLRREIEIAPSILRKIKIGLTFIWQWGGLRKWGSMIVSLVLVFLFWLFCMGQTYQGEVLMILLIFGFPATIYLMYKERTKKIKYGLIWILFPVLIFLSCPIDDVLFFAISAIVIDVIYVYKTRHKEVKNV